MKTRNQTSTRKCSDRAVWMLSTLLTRLNRVDSAGDMPEPGDQRQRRGDEHRDEVGEQLQAVVGDPAVLGRPVQRQVLDQHRHGVGEHVPARRHQPPPLAGREQQDVEDDAVEQPQGVDAEVPPAGQPDRVPQPGQADLAGQADRVLLRGPQRIGGHRLLDPEPVPARGAVPGPVQPGMVGEDLHPGPDDEDHQEQVEEVLPAAPRPATRRVAGAGRLDGAGVAGDEPLHRRQRRAGPSRRRPRRAAARSRSAAARAG